MAAATTEGSGAGSDGSDRLWVRNLGAFAVQLVLAGGLLAIPHLAERPLVFYTYYGAGILAIPPLFRLLSGRTFRPFQRLGFSSGLALHPYSMYFEVYPAVLGWDILTHFVSATLLACGLYALLIGLRAARNGATDASLLVHVGALLGVIVGAVLWEVYEIYAPWLTVYGTIDTLKDIFVAVVAWAVVGNVYPRLLGGIPAGIGNRLGSVLPGGSEESSVLA